MKYLVSRAIDNGSYLEVATFVHRYQAERYAEQESGLSGFSYTVEELCEERRLLSTFEDGQKAKREAA